MKKIIWVIIGFIFKSKGIQPLRQNNYKEEGEMFPGRWSKEEICKFVNCITWGIKGFSHEFLIAKEMQQISYMGRTCDINNHTFIKIWIFLFPKTLILWNAAVQEKSIPANIYLLNFDDRRTRKMFWNMFKVNNNNTRTMSLTPF